MPELGYVSEAYLQQTAAILTQIKRRSYELLAADLSRRVLDVGCGVGIDTEAISACTRADVVGLDRDPDMISRAVSRQPTTSSHRVFHLVGAAQSLPFITRSFDAARAERLFQHIPEPLAVLSELRRVVRPGGRVVTVDTDWGSLSIDDGGTAPRVERSIQRAIAELSLINGYSGRQQFRLMRHAGFRDVAVEIVPFHVFSYAIARDVGRLDEAERLALTAGWVSTGELARWRQTLIDSDVEGQFFASVNVITVVGVTQ